VSPEHVATAAIAAIGASALGRVALIVRNPASPEQNLSALERNAIALLVIAIAAYHFGAWPL